jgi:hypothetical protein
VTAKRVFILIVVIILVFLGGIGTLVLYASSLLDAVALAVILGALVGSIGGAVGAALTSLVTLWNQERENDERLKDRVSNHAVELTRLNYELRMKSLNTTQQTKEFLAPIKVYREVYKALLELHKTGNFPGTINDLGLLGMFKLGPDNAPKEKESRKDIETPSELE